MVGIDCAVASVFHMTLTRKQKSWIRNDSGHSPQSHDPSNPPLPALTPASKDPWPPETSQWMGTVCSNTWVCRDVFRSKSWHPGEWPYFPGQSWTFWRSVIMMYTAPEAMGLHRDGIWSWRNAICENRYGIICPTCHIFPLFLRWWILLIHTKQPDYFTPAMLLHTYAAVILCMPEETWVSPGEVWVALSYESVLSSGLSYELSCWPVMVHRALIFLWCSCTPVTGCLESLSSSIRL